MGEGSGHKAFRFGMDIDDVRPGVDEPVHLGGGILNHQMAVYQLIGISSDGFNVHDTHGKVWYECAVHDVAVKDVYAGIIQCSDFISQMTVVSTHH